MTSVMGAVIGLTFLFGFGDVLAASVTTLASDGTEPLLARHHGKAACDVVGPLLLVGWVEAGR
ncbi:hypothetical protein [Streptomyces mayteni]